MPTINFLHISLADQVLYGFADDALVVRLPVSTALNGPGELNGSGCTPRGLHTVRAKIGDDLPEGAVLRGRRWTSEIWSAQLAEQYPGRDWILSRILWLSGCELGRNRMGNVDTFRRYIYLHGTPPTEPMGVALSHGCIRLRNGDLIDLFARVAVGCRVLIDEAPCPQWAQVSLN